MAVKDISSSCWLLPILDENTGATVICCPGILNSFDVRSRSGTPIYITTPVPARLMDREFEIPLTAS